MDFKFRPATVDKDIFFHINRINEYRLPNFFDGDDIIIDIGAHIGGFSYACLQRGSNYVYGYEGEQENYNLAVENLKVFGNKINLFNKAVWRSDRKDKLFLTIPNHRNTGSGSVIWGTTGQEVDTISLDDIILNITENGRKRIRLIKIDCEGAEFPILLTSKILHLVDNICGEYHEFGDQIPEKSRVKGVERFTVMELTSFLEKVGFSVKSFHNIDKPQLGMFFAWRDESMFEDNRLLLQFYGRLKEECLRILEGYYNNGVENIVLYGSAYVGELFYIASQESKVKVVGIVDGDVGKHGKKMGNITVSAPSTIRDFKPDAVLITSFAHADEIYKSIQHLEKNDIRIFTL